VKRYLLIAVALLAGLAIAAQFAIPSIAEHQVESRLTEGGGSAQASISALPAERLLFGDGHRIDVTATNLSLDLADETGNVFSKLDGFDQVHVSITDSRVGPFAIRSFALDRDGGGAYRLTSSSSTTGTALLQFGATQLGIPGAGLLGAVAGQFSDANRAIPIEMDMQMESDGGVIRVVSGGGTIAGYPTGPLAELVTAAIAVRL
jgi:hypothetical protein